MRAERDNIARQRKYARFTAPFSHAGKSRADARARHTIRRYQFLRVSTTLPKMRMGSASISAAL